MKPWERGYMVPRGARMPRGGALGDHYDIYAHMRYDPARSSQESGLPSDIQLLFNNAFVGITISCTNLVLTLWIGLVCDA